MGKIRRHISKRWQKFISKCRLKENGNFISEEKRALNTKIMNKNEKAKNRKRSLQPL